MSTIAELQAARAKLLDPEDFPLSMTHREVEAYETRRQLLQVRIHSALTSQMSLAEAESQLPALEKWAGLLTPTRQDLAAEVMANPKAPNVNHLLQCIRVIDHGLRIFEADGMFVAGDLGYILAASRLGQLLAERGHIAMPSPGRPITVGIRDDSPWMNWHGSLPETKRKIKALTELRDQAQDLLDRALNDDDVAAGRMPSPKPSVPKPVRKIRADGSVYLRHPDGSEEEVSGPTEMTSTSSRL